MERNPSSSLTGAIRDYQSHLLTMSETYVRDIKHEWMICFGVPYGTNLWQVGDSKQQNGSYKMSMTKHKDEIVKRKLTKLWSKPQFKETDIIPAVNSSWNESFARVSSNQDAISKKGWNPWNRNLLLSEQIRMTMNEDDKQWEKNNIEISPHSLMTIFAEQNLNLPEDEDVYLQPKYSSNETKLNFSCGEAARCLVSLVSQQDLQSARSHIEKNRDIGKMRQELVNGAKKLSSGNLFLAGICSVGQEVGNCMINNTARIQQEEQIAYEKARDSYLVLFSKANTARQNKPDWTS